MRIICFLSLIVLIACSSKYEDEKLNAKSVAIHNSMVVKAGEIEDELLLLKSDLLSTVNKDSINAVLFDLELWKNDLVEVPGNESHHEEHHHDHSNKTLEVTALQMLQIQQELDKRLITIGNRASSLLNHLQE